MKTAIVLFNLGGPDGPEAVKPFRVNLFSDKAIIRAPIFIRFWLSRLIAASSAKAAAENYKLMGGKSPLLDLTQQQARALEAELGGEVKTFIAMRYWHPFAKAAAQEVKAWNPDRILLLPLYPQFSTTTTGSSLTDWHEAAAAAGLGETDHDPVLLFRRSGLRRFDRRFGGRGASPRRKPRSPRRQIAAAVLRPTACRRASSPPAIRTRRRSKQRRQPSWPASRTKTSSI